MFLEAVVLLVLTYFTGKPPIEYDAHLLNHAHLFLCLLQSPPPSGCLLLLSISMCMCLYQSVTPLSIFYYRFVSYSFFLLFCFLLHFAVLISVFFNP